ncbi:hypothetical protein [Parabacteroides gordonii]|uniref:DUF6913 domain-containing protein n=1 Tax=Parabacteroides gordonii TaxID=574930 RepID=UPI0026EE3AF6|nr:hypothetical protein [Parabacteroides gordonii]
MKLTNHFIRKKVKDLAGAKKRRSYFCTLKDARHIMVLFDAEDRDAVEPCLETLRMMHKRINVCAYVAGDVAPGMDPAYMVIHGKTDLGLLSIPKDEIRKKFCACEADILIDLTHGNNYVMQYLLLQHPGTFKVGARSSELDLYDLTISVTEEADIKHIFGHILFYLQTIRSK